MKNRIAIVGTLCALIALIFSSGQVIESARSALSVCARVILPSLFPFFVISILLGKLGLPIRLGRVLAPLAGKLFGVSGEGASALLIGLTGGYPLGASYIADMVADGSVSPDEGERLLVFCNNSGPAFLIGAVGVGVFGSSGAGLLLYGAHMGAALLAGLLFRRGAVANEDGKPVRVLPFSTAFPEAVRQAVSSTLAVCGFVVCFTVLVGLLDAHGLFSQLSGWLSAASGLEMHAARALLTGFWEIGSAAGAMQGLTATPENLALAAAILGWGGLSVHCQTLAVLADSELHTSRHFLGRVLSACLSALLAWAGAHLLF